MSDSLALQKRVTGTCAAGSAIKAVNAGGKEILLGGMFDVTQAREIAAGAPSPLSISASYLPSRSGRVGPF
jgi:hypothetical protein